MTIKWKDAFVFWSVPLMLFLLWYLSDIVLLAITALVIGSAVQIWALWMKSKVKIPFAVGIFLIYAIFIAILFFTFYGLFPIIGGQIKNLIPNLQLVLQALNIKGNGFINGLIGLASDKVGNLATYALDIVGGIFSFFLILVLSFYFSTSLGFYREVAEMLPIKEKDRFIRIWERARRRFATWFAAQITLMVIIGIATFLFMSSLGVPNAALIGTIAGLTEIVPILGPIIAAIIASLIVVSYNAQLIWWVLGGFLIIQQLENNLLVPIIMKKALAINPIFILLGVMVGGTLGGVLGVVTILPILVLSSEITRGLRD